MGVLLTVTQAVGLNGHSTHARTGRTPAPVETLPYAVLDDDYLAAIKRFHATVPRFPRGHESYHSHTDLVLVGLSGVGSGATLDHWQKDDLGRDEERAPGWQSTVVWGVQQNWSTREGTAPLRLAEIADLAPRPGPMERRIKALANGYVTLQQRNIEGVEMSCSGVFGGAEICFDDLTGFPADASLDAERVVYKEWGQFDGASYPSRWEVYRGQRLQMEAKTTVTALEGPDTLFAPLSGVTAEANLNGAPRETPHQILSRGSVDSPSYGQALVKVSVDGAGRVRNAELLDADDRALGAAAVKAARQTVYVAEEAQGRNVPFETTFRVNQWSTVDPLTVVGTGRRLQGED